MTCGDYCLRRYTISDLLDRWLPFSYGGHPREKSLTVLQVIQLTPTMDPWSHAATRQGAASLMLLTKGATAGLERESSYFYRACHQQ